jgi:hypothetical protein
MARLEEDQGNNDKSEDIREQAHVSGQQDQPGDQGLPEDLLDAATGAAGRTGSGGPTDAGDLGQFGSSGDLAGRDTSREGLDQDGGAATMGTDIGRGSA